MTGRAPIAALLLAAACAPAPEPGADSAAVPAPRAAGATTGGVMPGVEVLLRDSLHLLAGKRVGLITNPSGRDRRGTSTIHPSRHTFRRVPSGATAISRMK